MNGIISVLTSILAMSLSFIFTNDFIHLTVIYFATFFITYCWFWPEFFKTIKKTESNGNC
ncbi:hypothetical protein ABLV90_07465 [Staphylococcus sp. 2S1]|uniref:hypothetical protein n=1 Tax=Staphylococcus TaxID=1279 RepID=UPI00115826D1|nr:hypothetical protein [Staphylococcus xylosus]